MKNHIQQELLKFHDLSANPCARLPPSVWVKLGVTTVSNRNLGAVPSHCTAEYAMKSTRVIGAADDENGAELSLVTPRRKNASFVIGPSDRAWDLLDGNDAERLQLSHGALRRVFVGHPPTEEFAVDLVRRIREYSHPRGDAAACKVCGFKHSGSIHIDGQDNDIGGSDSRFIDHEEPPRRFQD